MAVSSLKNKSKLSTLTSPFDIDLGGMIPLSTVTVSATSQASVQFTGIPGYYEHLQIRGTLQLSGVNNFRVRLNSDTGNNYAWHHVFGGGAAVATDSATSTNRILGGYVTNPTSTFNAFILDILDYANTNKYKVTRMLTGIDSNGGGNIQFQSGLWQNTNAITTLSFDGASGESVLQNSSFALYGIKRAGA